MDRDTRSGVELDGDEGSRRGKGQLLKVRLGYNANSSSLASVVTMLLFGSGAAVALLSLVAGALFSRRPHDVDPEAPGGG